MTLFLQVSSKKHTEEEEVFLSNRITNADDICLNISLSKSA